MNLNNFNFDRVTVVVRDMNPYAKYGMLLYMISSVLYTGRCSYYDSQKMLLDYRENKSEKNEYTINNKRMSTEWDAAKNGATVNASNNICKSFMWPFNAVMDIIPACVMAMNKQEKKD